MELLCCVQGVFAPKTYAEYGLPGSWYGALEWQYPPHQRQGAYEEEGRAVNTMKVGLSCQLTRVGVHSIQSPGSESLCAGKKP